MSIGVIGAVCLQSAQAAPREPAVSSRSWAEVASFWGIQNLWGLNCPSRLTCEAVGAIGGAGVALRTTDGGARWVDQPLPPGVTGLSALACHSTSVCEAVGEDSAYRSVALRTTDGGARWVAHEFPSGIRDFHSLSCPSASVCQVFGENSTGYGGETSRTSHGGATWVNKALPGTGQPLALACPSTSLCEGVAESPRDYPMVLRTTNGGKTWADKTLPITTAQYLASVVCQSATLCEASGDPGSGPAGPAHDERGQDVGQREVAVLERRGREFPFLSLGGGLQRH